MASMEQEERAAIVEFLKDSQKMIARMEPYLTKRGGRFTQASYAHIGQARMTLDEAITAIQRGEHWL